MRKMFMEWNVVIFNIMDLLNSKLLHWVIGILIGTLVISGISFAKIRKN